MRWTVETSLRGAQATKQFRIPPATLDCFAIARNDDPAPQAALREKAAELAVDLAAGSNQKK
jgi:hypothetical protein